MNSWEESACYPRGSFYPLSDGPSTRGHRITKSYFRTCSACQPHSQASFYLCALQLISIQPEETLERLRYSLGGDRPSQTAHLPLSSIRIHGYKVRTTINKRWYFTDVSTKPESLVSKTPTYTTYCQP